jgi:hypothetical protein
MEGLHSQGIGQDAGAVSPRRRRSGGDTGAATRSFGEEWWTLASQVVGDSTRQDSGAIPTWKASDAVRGLALTTMALVEYPKNVADRRAGREASQMDGINTAIGLLDESRLAL